MAELKANIEAGNALVGERRRAGTAVRLYLTGIGAAGEEVWYFPDPRGGKLVLPHALAGTPALEFGGIGSRVTARLRFSIGPENRWLVRGYESPDGDLRLVLPDAPEALAYVYWYQQDWEQIHARREAGE